MTLLSVLMPAHNAERTIQLAVESTLKCLPIDSNLVVVDDGSVDSTERILRSISLVDPRLIVIRLDVNVGVAAALNYALSCTSSTYIGRMDSDDISLPWRFRRSVSLVESGKADLVFSPVLVFDENKKAMKYLLRPTAPVSISSSLMPASLLLVNPVAHPTMVARRSVIVAAGGYRSVPSEDYDLWMRIAENGGRVIRLAMPGVIYRRHENQLTRNDHWIEGSRVDRQTEAAHFGLCKEVLGSGHSVFGIIRGSRGDTTQITELFFPAIKEHSRTLNWRDGFQLRWQLKKAQRRLDSMNRSVVSPGE